MLFSGTTMRTRVYVDGFNLYYGALKGTPFKWLNPVDLTRRVLPAGYIMDKLLYFTAHVSGVSDPGAPARQRSELLRRARPEAKARPGRRDEPPDRAARRPPGHRRSTIW